MNQSDSEHTQSTHTDPWRSARDLLGSHAERGWVFGVCAALAERTGWELWAVRAATLVLLLMFWWLPMAIAYLVMAMLLDETRPGTQQKLKRWARRADDLLEVVWSGLKRAFGDKRKEFTRGETYSGSDGL